MARLMRIAGRVQGVGYREWLMAEARAHGLAGWVRNRRDGTVEALLAGELPAVQAVLLACRRGPSLARVDSVNETLADDPVQPGFTRLPTM